MTSHTATFQLMMLIVYTVLTGFDDYRWNVICLLYDNLPYY